MTRQEIYKAIENAKWESDKSPFGKCESSEILFFIGKNKAYGVHGINYGEGIEICFAQLHPKLKFYSKFDEDSYPKEIETMKSIWYSELMEKYGDIDNTMKSFTDLE